MWECHGVPLRPSITAVALAAALWMLGSGLAQAQQQERTLEQRLTRPDMTLTAKEQGKGGFGGGKSFSTGNANSKKSFLGLPRFPLKSFFGAKTYQNNSGKSFWTSEFKPTQKSETMGNKKSLFGSDKSFEVKSATLAKADATEAGKGYQATNTFQTKSTKMEGKSQKSLDQEHSKKEMTIDEVRELLNKNK